MKGGEYDLKLVALFIVLSVFLSSAVFAQSAFAASGNMRPGWGFGDKNHVHTGPPGQSVRADVSESVKVSANTGGNIVGDKSVVLTGNATVMASIENFFTHLFGEI